MNWNAATAAGWLTLGPASGKDAGTITLTAAVGSLASGTYNTTITLSATGATAVMVPVSLTVAAAPVPPVIQTSTTSLSFTAEQGSGNSSSQTVGISNTGGGLLTWTVSDNAAWLSLSSSSGTGTGSITATAATGSLEAGTYNALITVNATSATPVSIPVTFTVTEPAPSLTLNPPSVTLTGVQGGANPARQTVTVNSNGAWTARSNVSWLTLSPASGTGNGSIATSVVLSSAVVGPNNATITVTRGTVTRTISVALSVSAASLTASPTSMTYSATEGAANPATQTIAINSTGAWTVSDNAAWLSLSSSSGTGTGSITATAATGSLEAGTYNALITVNATSATPVSIPVTFTVTEPAPSLTLNPPSVTLTGVQGGTNPARQTVTVNSNGAWTARSNVSWLTLSPASGTGNGSIATSVVLSSAVVGSNNAMITVTRGTVTRTISVALTLSAASLTASPTSMTYSATEGAANPATQTIAINSTGAWTVSDNAAWLSLSSTSGTGTRSITATAATGSLEAGTYNALITVNATSARTVSIPVTFTVKAPAPSLTLSPSSVTLTGIQGGTNPTSQTLTVNSNGAWTARSNVSWLTLSPASGTGNGSIATNVVLSSAVVGPNNATITVTSGGATRTISVALSVSAGSLTASPTSMTYTATRGAANPSAQTIAINSTGAWTASEGASWLALSRTSGSNNGTITASVNTATATQGNNTTTITVTSGGKTKTVNVTLTLNAPSSSSVTLTWNANTESDLAGYRIYRATSSGTYGAPIATLQGNTTSYSAMGLQFGTTYFFVVTAFDIAGNESAYSNEVSKSIF